MASAGLCLGPPRQADITTGEDRRKQGHKIQRETGNHFWLDKWRQFPWNGLEWEQKIVFQVLMPPISCCTFLFILVKLESVVHMLFCFRKKQLRNKKRKRFLDYQLSKLHLKILVIVIIKPKT